MNKDKRAGAQILLAVTVADHGGSLLTSLKALGMHAGKEEFSRK